MTVAAIKRPTNLHGHRAVFAIGLLERDASITEAKNRLSKTPSMTSLIDRSMVGAMIGHMAARIEQTRLSIL